MNLGRMFAYTAPRDQETGWEGSKFSDTLCRFWFSLAEVLVVACLLNLAVFTVFTSIWFLCN